MYRHSRIAKNVAASLASLETPAKSDSPASAITPELKKVRTPEKTKQDVSETEETVVEVPSIQLPIHYQRLVEDLRILDETLSIFRVKNQIPFHSVLRTNIERVSGRRFTLDHFRQLMTATNGILFRAEWQPVTDVDGKTLKIDLAIRAIDHDKEGIEIFKRMTPAQSKSRNLLITDFLASKLNDYMSQDPGRKVENAFPIKPFELPEKPQLDGKEEVSTTPASGRARVLSRCDSVASNGSDVKTPKSSLRRQLSVSASPVMPNALPQFITPVKLPERPESTSPVAPMSAKEKLDAIRNRVKAREVKDVEEAKQYDRVMEQRAKLDEYDLCVKLLVKLNHKFPRGIDTAKLSTLAKDYGSLFVNADDVEKWSRKVAELVPHRFGIEKIGEELVLKLKTTDVKFSVIKKEIEDLKTTFAASVRE